MPRLRRWSTALRMFCRETPVSSRRLTTFSTRMSRKEYSRCVPEPVALRTDGATSPGRAQKPGGRGGESGRGPVVELPVGDACSGTRRRATVTDEVGVDLVVRRSPHGGVAEELTLGAIALVAHVSVPLLSRNGTAAGRRSYTH